MSYRFFTVSGYYGSGHTPTDVFCAEVLSGVDAGATWYVAEGAQTVNLTFDELHDGVDIELLSDNDCFTWCPVNSLDELQHSLSY